MKDRPYADLQRDDLILRDHLALDRTLLANERTLLAYIRTALALFAAGVTLIQFFDRFLFVVIGWILIPLGLVTAWIGLYRFRKVRDAISAHLAPMPQENKS